MAKDSEEEIQEESLNEEAGTAASAADFAEFSAGEQEAATDEEGRRRNLEALYEVPLTVTVRLGETQMSIKDLLNLGPGSLVELEQEAGQSVDLLVNGIRVGSGDAVVVDEHFGLRINELISAAERLVNL